MKAVIKFIINTIRAYVEFEKTIKKMNIALKNYTFTDPFSMFETLIEYKGFLTEV